MFIYDQSLKEGSRYHDKCTLFMQNFENFKMNNIVGVKRDTFMSYGEQSLQWINARWENHHPLKRSLVEGMD